MSEEPLDRVREAAVLLELGEVYDAEREVGAVLDELPDDAGALGLMAKVKHMRGQLSEAVAYWARLHAQSPPEGAALMHLSSMLQLARDPERNAGEFLALGPFQLWRKPAAHLELEEAFRLFLSRRPDQARERCARLSRAQRGKDRDLYKLAVLADAWISELSGDREEALRTLEALGEERGFATDDDRILALARLYEQSGGEERLWKALHICQHLEQRGQSSMLGRLASLNRALGREEEARRYERRYLAAFRRRMGRPSRQELATSASRRYLPLARVVEIAPEAGETEPPGASGEVSPRRRAVEAFLGGRRDEARALFQAGQANLDRKYLAELAALEGRPEEAVHLFLESLAGEPADLRVLEWLLRRHALTPSPSIAARLQGEAGERALAALLAAVKTSPLRPSLWRVLATLHAIRGADVSAARCLERAAVLDEAAERRGRAVGRALAAAVYHFASKPKGLIHEVWATRRPVAPSRGGFLEEVLGNLTGEMVQAVRNTFLSVREYARARFPHLTRDVLDYGYTFKMTKDDEPSGGLSAGLPTALAFLSVFLDRPLPQDVASSGCLVADAHDVLVVKGVGEPEYKVRGAYNRNLRLLLLPRENRRELAATPLVPREVCGELVRHVADLDEAATLVFGEEVWGLEAR